MSRLFLPMIFMTTLMAAAALAGSLDPPSAPSATPGPEPRIPISTETTPGDSDSTFRITEPGSYYLTGNITGESGKSGIEIATSGVTLDLMGFALEGVPGSEDGITYSGTSLQHWTIRNGVIRGWGGTGLQAFHAGRSHIEGIVSASNGISGMQGSSETTFIDCTVTGNSGTGIVSEDRCTLTRVIADSNLGQGMNLGNSATVTDSQACNNGLYGILLGEACIIVRTVTDENGDDGIFGQIDSLISACHARANGDDGIYVDSGLVESCVCTENIGDGIEAFGRAIVRNNVSSRNGDGVGDGAGIHTTGWNNRIESNSVMDNDRGIDVDWHGTVVIGNTAAANTENYSITGTGAVGPIITSTGTITTVNPWANFSY